MTNEQRLAWLEEDTWRLMDVYNYVQKHNVSVDDAIDRLAELEREPVDVVVDN